MSLVTTGGNFPRSDRRDNNINAGEHRILVSVRLRPLNEKEIEKNDVSDWECVNDNTVIFKNSLQERSVFPTSYTYDKVFPNDASTRQVYEEGAKEVALSVISGINSSVFAYGQTSSGKTYTMTGITEYTVADIFDYIHKNQEREFTLKFSAIEIYNEAVRDLLTADATPLRVLDDPERGTIVEKLKEEILRDWNHMKELLSICEAQRQIGETSLNETSSRSHQILRLTIESSAREFLVSDNSNSLVASVNFVDLAGSERASQTSSAGTRLKEGCHINRSLLTLGTVIRKLSKGRNGHIPYRDSKLTRILQQSLGGNARTAIICTISPAKSHSEQSRNTLLFASCAKDVTTNAHVNVVISDKALVKHLQRELARLENEMKTPSKNAATYHSEELLKDKEIQIQKMENQIRELTQQRDIALSQLELLLREVESGQVSSLSSEFHESTVSNSSTDSQRFNGQQVISNLRSDEKCHFLCHKKEYDVLNTSPRLSVCTPRFDILIPEQTWDDITGDNTEDFEDMCKEVQCIDIEECSINESIESNSNVLEKNEPVPPIKELINGHVTDGASVMENIKVNHVFESLDSDPIVPSSISNDELLKHEESGFQQMVSNKIITSSEIHKSAKSIDQHCFYGSSLWNIRENLPISIFLKMRRSRSCRETVISNTASLWFNEVERDENSPHRWNDNKRHHHKRYPTDLDCGSSTVYQLPFSEHIASIDDIKEYDTKVCNEENTTNIHSFVTGLKEMDKLQYEKQLSSSEQKMDPTGDHSFIKDLDLTTNPLESSNYRMEFQKKHREIIELWHTCNVSLIHRSYFFLLFKGEDPSDTIYIEVELRRLSFLNKSLSKENVYIMENGHKALNSRIRALQREREMLCKQMLRKLTADERVTLYQKWGIKLDTKKRRRQLSRRIWTNPNEMEHIKESAILVAKLMDIPEQDKDLKEMFGFSFIPGRPSRRSYSWKYGTQV